MPDSLLGLAIGAAAMAIMYSVMSWFARVEKRATDRRWMERVYYPTRGRRADAQALFRPRSPRADNGEEPPPVATRGLPRHRSCPYATQKIVPGPSQEE